MSLQKGKYSENQRKGAEKVIIRWQDSGTFGSDFAQTVTGLYARRYSIVLFPGLSAEELIDSQGAAPNGFSKGPEHTPDTHDALTLSLSSRSNSSTDSTSQNVELTDRKRLLRLADEENCPESIRHLIGKSRFPSAPASEFCFLQPFTDSEVLEAIIEIERDLDTTPPNRHAAMIADYLKMSKEDL